MKTSSRRRRSSRHVLALVAGHAIALGSACAGDASDGNVQTHLVRASAIENLAPASRLQVDLRDHRAVWLFDQSAGAIAYERISLVSPQGATLPMDRWMTAVELTFDSALEAADAFALASAAREDVQDALASQLAPRCDLPSDCNVCLECVQCGDHWVCWNDCPGGVESERRGSVEGGGSRGPQPPEREPSGGPISTPSEPTPAPPSGSPPTPAPEPI